MQHYLRSGVAAHVPGKATSFYHRISPSFFFAVALAAISGITHHGVVAIVVRQFLTATWSFTIPLQKKTQQQHQDRALNWVAMDFGRLVD
jgi:hypothetical protein